MVKVPLEPTTEMKQAGNAVEIRDDDGCYFNLSWEEITAIYKAMINVAPKGENHATNQA